MSRSAAGKLPLFQAGDVGGLVYFFIGNIINYVIVIYALQHIGWPDELIFRRVIPGMSIGLMLGGLYYAYMGYKLYKKTGRTDLTALPSGLSTPAMFVYLYGIIYPLHYSGLEPVQCWQISTAACFLGGVIEMLGGLVGPTLRKILPRVAMLGTVAGVALVWMATSGLFEIYHDPILGLPILIICLVGLIGGYSFKGNLPMLLVATIVGIVYALLLGRTTVDTSTLALTVPVLSPGSVFEGLKGVGPYLVIIIPIMIYSFIETMDNVESAIAAGDEYPLGEAQVADGLCTSISALFGGIMPNVVWLGHAGLKKSRASIGYSWVGGLLFALCGLFGIFGVLNSLMPPVIACITFLWCAMLMIVQAYTDNPRRHGAALAIALVPHLADLLYTTVTGALGAFEKFIEHSEDGAFALMMDSSDPASRALVDYGVMWKGVAALRHGSIIVSIMWASTVVFIVDRRLDKAAAALFCAAVLSFFGFIHAPHLGLNAAPAYTIGYMEISVICLVFHFLKDKIMNYTRRYDYV